MRKECPKCDRGWLDGRMKADDPPRWILCPDCNMGIVMEEEEPQQTMGIDPGNSIRGDAYYGMGIGQAPSLLSSFFGPNPFSASWLKRQGDPEEELIARLKQEKRESEEYLRRLLGGDGLGNYGFGGPY